MVVHFRWSRPPDRLLWAWCSTGFNNHQYASRLDGCKRRGYVTARTLLSGYTVQRSEFQKLLKITGHQASRPLGQPRAQIVRMSSDRSPAAKCRAGAGGPPPSLRQRAECSERSLAVGIGPKPKLLHVMTR